MTRQVYSELIAFTRLASVGTSLLGNPPMGTMWIIKDATVQLDEPFPHEWPGWYLQDDHLVPWFSRLNHWCIGGASYEWHGSQVIPGGGGVYFKSLAETWCVRISGYQLTLP